MGLSTDTDKSLTEIVNDLHEEIDFLNKELEKLRQRGDAWCDIATHMADRLVDTIEESRK